MAIQLANREVVNRHKWHNTTNVVIARNRLIDVLVNAGKTHAFGYMREMGSVRIPEILQINGKERIDIRGRKILYFDPDTSQAYFTASLPRKFTNVFGDAPFEKAKERFEIGKGGGDTGTKMGAIVVAENGVFGLFIRDQRFTECLGGGIYNRTADVFFVPLKLESWSLFTSMRGNQILFGNTDKQIVAICEGGVIVATPTHGKITQMKTTDIGKPDDYTYGYGFNVTEWVSRVKLNLYLDCNAYSGTIATDKKN